MALPSEWLSNFRKNRAEQKPLAIPSGACEHLAENLPSIAKANCMAVIAYAAENGANHGVSANFANLRTSSGQSTVVAVRAMSGQSLLLEPTGDGFSVKGVDQVDDRAFHFYDLGHSNTADDAVELIGGAIQSLGAGGALFVKDEKDRLGPDGKRLNAEAEAPKL